jgi:nitrile hydratase accessory protein
LIPLEALELPRLPKDANGPVFAEPWQAQAFALAVQLNALGVFSWAEWAGALGAALASDPQDDGSRYYHHWVEALETLTLSHGLTGESALAARKEAWAQAFLTTPHGSPVHLT